MLVVTALGCFPLLWWLMLARTGCGRVGFLLGAVGWATYLVAVTELFSLGELLRPIPLAGAWGVLLIALAVLARRAAKRHDVARDPWRRFLRNPIALGLAVILCMLLVIAIVAPPNTWDAMTYHMSRVAHWAQNGTVATYATHNARQIHMAPGAEFAILHLQILTGGDRLANLVQWFAFVGCIVGASVIARGLGAGPRGQFFAAALCGSLPMAVLQATSTQNDLVAALWLVAFVALGLELRHSSHQRLLIVAMGLSLGLAVLTKPTAFLVLPAFSLFVLFAIPVSPWLRVRGAAVVLLLGALVNAGYFTRNALASGSVLGPQVEEADGVTYSYTNDVVTPRTVTSNVLRNVALQLALPSWIWNKRVGEFVRTAHFLMGVDIDDPRTTMGRQQFHLSGAGDREDQAQGVIILLLGAVALLVLLRAKDSQRRLQLAYICCVIVSFVLFCAMLKWQPWNTRLHLPMLILLTPAVGAFLERHLPRVAQTPLVLIVLLACLPNVLRNPSRPMLGKYSIFRVPRAVQYFNNRADLLAPYTTTAEEVATSGCDRVGLIIPQDGWEYPLWVLLKRGQPNVRIEHLAVKNYTAPYAKPFEPCVILRIGKDGRPVVQTSK
jgi:4-amino-4-deoxy-L-arabinose transferase-like glycosyltransferase